MESEVVALIVAASSLGGALGGVWLGSHLDRKARRDERRRTEFTELRRDASEILGTARMVLTAMEPGQYAMWADERLAEVIETRRHEANDIRPRLAALGVRWPDARVQLYDIGRFMGLAPQRLSFLVRQVLDHKEYRDLLDQLTEQHSAATTALDQAISMLDTKDELEAGRS